MPVDFGSGGGGFWERGSTERILRSGGDAPSIGQRASRPRRTARRASKRARNRPVRALVRRRERRQELRGLLPLAAPPAVARRIHTRRRRVLSPTVARRRSGLHQSERLQRRFGCPGWHGAMTGTRWA